MSAINDLSQAILYYSGGTYRIDTRDADWRALASRIEAEGYTPEEYIHFFIAVVSRGEAAKLTYKNYVVCEASWQKFQSHKENRREEVGVVVRLQREKLEASMKLFGTRKALLNDNIEASPLLRIEVALYLQDMEGFDPTEVLDRYTKYAEHMLKGCPEYRMYLPYISQTWEA
jgi:hypothetical protein